ncbi:MAG: 50S ribosomal protein L13 [Candidatus Nanoarchaeia archaeon]|nr:50S ribosomal protein L13 [Candidatus Nanoarchaeia archaeon]
MRIIDAKKLVLGRMAAVVSKMALKGETIIILNSEKAVITGSKKDVLMKYNAKKQRGDPYHGPYFPRGPQMIVKRTIRGMLPYKQEKGLKAFKNIKCYLGIPEEFKDKKLETIEDAKLSKKVRKYISLGEISSLI